MINWYSRWAGGGGGGGGALARRAHRGDIVEVSFPERELSPGARVWEVWVLFMFLGSAGTDVDAGGASQSNRKAVKGEFYTARYCAIKRK